MKSRLLAVAVVGAATIMLSACGSSKHASPAPSNVSDKATTTTIVTTTTLAATPSAAVTDAKAQLATINSDLSDANESLSTVQKDISSGEGDVQ